MKHLLLFLLGGLALAGHLLAVEIAWDSPREMTGQLSDFETEGSIVHAWNGGGGGLLLDSGGLNMQFTQLWMADTRSTTQHRQKTYDSGAGTTQVVLDSGPPSESASGSFVADATSQQLRCVGSSGADHPQYNFLILRDLGPQKPAIAWFELSDGSMQSDGGLSIAAGSRFERQSDTFPGGNANLSYPCKQRCGYRKPLRHRVYR